MDDIVHGLFPDRQAAVAARLREVFDAAASKDFERLAGYHLASPKFSAFSDVGPQRRIGVEENNRLEREEFEALDAFETTFDDLQVDVFGPVAIATAVLPYTYRSGEETGSASLRLTLVLVDDGESWKIAHEHASPFTEAP